MNPNQPRHAQSSSDKSQEINLARGSHSINESGHSKTDHPRINLAVVGARGVGKSTFIQYALDLKQPDTSLSSTKKMSLDGTVYVVNLWKILPKEMSVPESNRIVWPRFRGEQELPPIDGALVLYDATSPKSVVEISRILHAMAESALPFELVACKCDVSHFSGRSDPVTIEQADKILRRYTFQETSLKDPRTHRRCISSVLRSIITRTSDLTRLHQSGDSHPLSNSSFETQSPQPLAAQDRRADSEAARTTSRTSGDSGVNINRGPSASAPNREVDGTGTNRVPSDKTTGSTVALNAPSSRYARSNSHPVQPKTPPSGTRVNSRRPSSPGLRTSISPHRQNAQCTTWRFSAGADAFSSFLDMEEETDDSRSRPASSEQFTTDRQHEATANETGVTFDELVDRLVALPMSKQDTKFAAIFLCLYRKFAAPSKLLNALIDRFDKTEQSSAPPLTRTSDQLRLLNVLAQWVAEYPGDFAYPKTRAKLLDFVAALEKNHIYLYAAKEISLHLEVVVEDDDVGWPFNDGDEDGDGEKPEGGETFLHASGRSSPSTLLNHLSFSDPVLLNMSSLDLTEDQPEMSSRDSGTLSGSSSAGRSVSTLTQSSSTLAALENAQREAATLELTPKHLLTKVQWRQFMEIPEDDFARELTRMDWIMYSSFRPRDLVRHVSISGDKDKIKSLENVNRMIKEFNHLAFFVASMILLRDKPKHRAQALEKFMNIAQKLRRQNNYNSLGAVIAGINGTPVQRLSQTRELIPPSVQKEFMRLVILMGTQKSHFAYRLAWENSFGERIPFLPLHRRDLVSAEEGNKTFIGDNKDRINWKKFDIMGEVVLDIQRSQRTPYPYIQKNEEVQRLVLDTKMRDEEDLYTRSMQVEPSAAGVDPGRKKFGWLRN
ncbi:hypothetical protein VTN77DRAFT_4271 [Rasamsonia byssochlamydoides]|uniref:uncharacterized protein n=1 Tax=Rasamsonia byssochlamydoides TaxID=89139 RepID=UPI0037439156